MLMQTAPWHARVTIGAINGCAESGAVKLVQLATHRESILSEMRMFPALFVALFVVGSCVAVLCVRTVGSCH